MVGVPSGSAECCTRKPGRDLADSVEHSTPRRYLAVSCAELNFYILVSILGQILLSSESRTFCHVLGLYTGSVTKRSEGRVDTSMFQSEVACAGDIISCHEARIKLG